MAKRDFQSASDNGGLRKRGRKELRTIRRADQRADQSDAHNDEHAQLLEEDLSSNDQKFKSSKFGKALKDVEEDSENKEKVYQALLTILKSEHPKVQSRKKKAAKENDEGSQEQSSDENEVKEEFDELEELEDNLERVPAEQSDEEGIDLEDESENIKDPFDSHFNMVSEDFINKLDKGFANKKIKYKSIKSVADGTEQMIFSVPTLSDDIEGEVELPMHKSSLDSYFLKQRLKIQNNLMGSEKDDLTPLQKEIVDPMFQYKDLLYEYNSYGKDEEEYRYLYVLHVLNHIYKTRDRILKNNQRINDNTDSEYLDQGFTRPKVLIVVPTRNTAYEVVSKIMKESGIDQVDKKSKFRDQFYENSSPPSVKPKSFQEIFKGNSNDFFVLGMKFTRKAIKLYSNFYQSDIIICSPLGLQLIVENTDKKKRQDDFLSSIEISIFDQFHSIEFQNVSHVVSIFDHLNKIPQDQHDTDFGRVRMWYINEQAKLLRQTMIFTKYVSPTANSIINNRCRNWSGRWKNHHLIESNESSVGKLGFKIRQIFQRIDLGGASIVDEPDYRFKYFINVIIPSIVKSTGYEDGILVYVPEYSDFIRIRNYLKDKTSIFFGDINEYSDQRQLGSNRSLFQQGRVKVLLYTERLHHFRRYQMKGVKNVIFYQPPTNPEFYNEVVRFIGKSAFLGDTDLNISTVRCIYSKLDGLNLERIVGTKRAAVLTHAQNELYEFK